MECKAGLAPKALLLHTIHDTHETMWVTSHASSLQGQQQEPLLRQHPCAQTERESNLSPPGPAGVAPAVCSLSAHSESERWPCPPSLRVRM